MLEYIQNTKKPEGRSYTPYQIVYGETPAVTTIKKIRETQKLEREQEDTG